MTNVQKYVVGILHGTLYWTNPDRDGTVTEQTSIHRAIILKSAILISIYVFSYQIYIHLFGTIAVINYNKCSL